MTRGCGRRHTRRYCRFLAHMRVCEIAEIEPFVLDDGAADARTCAVLVIPGLRGDPLSNKFLINGVQFPILKIFVKRTMYCIRAALYDNIELPASGMTELGIVIVLQE